MKAAFFLTLLALPAAAVGPHNDYAVERPITPYRELAHMFFIGLMGEWESRTIHVPYVAGGVVVSCYQAVEETATADCFYVAHDDSGKEIAGVTHVILEPAAVMILGGTEVVG